MKSSLALVALLVVGIAPGCGATSSGRSCVAGRTIGCACPNGRTGTQMCATTGDRYAACQCGPSAAAPARSRGSTPSDDLPAEMTQSEADRSGVPHIKELSPSAGPSRGGNLVEILGSGFKTRGGDTVAVKFGDGAATIAAFEADDKILVQPPAGPKGRTVNVTVSFDEVELVFPNSYTYE